MASWMVHPRVADRMLDRIPGISETEFVIGNMAPDSGIPNEDWTVFTPSSEVSHFRTTDDNGIKLIHEDWYIAKYFTKEQRRSYSIKQESFYLGYLVHLLTDNLWARDIVYPLRAKNFEAFEQNRAEWFRVMKQDWRTLDLLFLKEHADFRAFLIYEQAVGFRNAYMDFFAEDAFDNRRAYITQSYRTNAESVEAESRFLSDADIERFVQNAQTKSWECLKRKQTISVCFHHTVNREKEPAAQAGSFAFRDSPRGRFRQYLAHSAPARGR